MSHLIIILDKTKQLQTRLTDAFAGISKAQELTEPLVESVEQDLTPNSNAQYVALMAKRDEISAALSDFENSIGDQIATLMEIAAG